MTSSVDTVPVLVQPRSSPNTSTSQGNRGGNRSGNRGKIRNVNREGNRLAEQQTADPEERSRGGRRGRGNRGNNVAGGRNRNQSQLLNSTIYSVPPLDPPPGQGGGGSFGDRLTKDAIKLEGEVRSNEQADGEDDVEGEVCFICASSVVHISVAPCNHRTCHICALRLLALYKTRACAHCRVSNSISMFRAN